VRSLDITQRVLSEGEISTQRMGSRLVAAFPPELGRGAWLFSEASEGAADPQ
jgi:hypothetical protein